VGRAHTVCGGCDWGRGGGGAVLEAAGVSVGCVGGGVVSGCSGGGGVLGCCVRVCVLWSGTVSVGCGESSCRVSVGADAGAGGVVSGCGVCVGAAGGESRSVCGVYDGMGVDVGGGGGMLGWGSRVEGASAGRVPMLGTNSQKSAP
jgi:hypothetical protein